MSETFSIPGVNRRNADEFRRWQRGDGAVCSNERPSSTFVCGAPVVTSTKGRKVRLCKFHLAQRFVPQRSEHISTQLERLALEELIGSHLEEFAGIKKRLAEELERERLAQIPADIVALIEATS